MQQPEPVQSIFTWLREPLSEINAALAAAEFQLDRSAEQRRVDAQVEERKTALALCADLIGSKQADLLARFCCPLHTLLCRMCHSYKHTSEFDVRKQGPSFRPASC